MEEPPSMLQVVRLLRHISATRRDLDVVASVLAAIPESIRETAGRELAELDAAYTGRTAPPDDVRWGEVLVVTVSRALGEAVDGQARAALAHFDPLVVDEATRISRRAAVERAQRAVQRRADDEFDREITEDRARAAAEWQEWLAGGGAASIEDAANTLAEEPPPADHEVRFAVWNDDERVAVSVAPTAEEAWREAIGELVRRARGGPWLLHLVGPRTRRRVAAALRRLAGHLRIVRLEGRGGDLEDLVVAGWEPHVPPPKSKRAWYVAPPGTREA